LAGLLQHIYESNALEIAINEMQSQIQVFEGTELMMPESYTWEDYSNIVFSLFHAGKFIDNLNKYLLGGDAKFGPVGSIFFKFETNLVEVGKLHSKYESEGCEYDLYYFLKCKFESKNIAPEEKTSSKKELLESSCLLPKPTRKNLEALYYKIFSKDVSV
jgi:hypothetical protein